MSVCSVWLETADPQADLSFCRLCIIKQFSHYVAHTHSVQMKVLKLSHSKTYDQQNSLELVSLQKLIMDSPFFYRSFLGSIHALWPGKTLIGLHECEFWLVPLLVTGIILYIKTCFFLCKSAFQRAIWELKNHWRLAECFFLGDIGFCYVVPFWL